MAKVSRKDLLDPSEMLAAAIASGLDTGYTELDEGGIRKAPNVVDWMVKPQFLNMGVPFAKQIEDALLYFGELCLFCSNMPYVVDIPKDEKLGNILDNVVLLKHGRCPKCRRRILEQRKEWLLDPANANLDPRLKPDLPNDFVGIEGQRSTKSTKTAMYSTYIIHRYLCLPNPSKWFGLLPTVGTLHSTFVSVTAGQAFKNLWQPFLDFINGSPWFNKYHEWLDEQGAEKSMELYAKRETYILYRHKRLGLSYAPADSRTLRGPTRALCAVDELGWFSASQDRKGVSRVRADGDGTVRALARSLSTLRNSNVKIRKHKQNSPDAHMFTISSPSSATDPIVRRARRAPKSPRMYYILRTTWDANPQFTQESLRAQEGELSEQEFNCDYGCVAPYSDDPWWDNETALLELCNKGEDNPLWSAAVDAVGDKVGGTMRWIWQHLSNIKGDKQTSRVLSFDTGEKSCSFSWAIEKYDPLTSTVVVEDVGEVAPGDKERIHHGKMWEHVILPLVTNFRFLHVVWDRWESSRYVSDLRTEHKVKAEQFTAKTSDGRRLRTDMLNSLVVFPKPEVPVSHLPIGDNVGLARYPRSHLLLQMMTVRDNRGLPLKPQGGNDDTFRAVLLGHAFIRDNEKEYEIGAGRMGPRCVGVGVGGRPMGGGSMRSGQGVIIGNSGNAIGVGPRRY